MCVFLQSTHASKSVLTRKLGIKVLQRSTLAMLPVRPVAWRYQRGGGGGGGGGVHGGGGGGGDDIATSQHDNDNDGDNDSDGDVVPAVEESIEHLLLGVWLCTCCICM